MPGFWDYIQPPAPKPAPSQHRCDDYKCDECNADLYCPTCDRLMTHHGNGYRSCLFCASDRDARRFAR